MAEEQGQEKTELPTARRLDQAHDDGQVPRSQELSAAIIVLSGAAALAAFGGSSIGHGVTGVLRYSTSWLSAEPFTEAGATTLIRDVTRATMFAVLPFFAAIAIPALVINAIQGRGVLSLKPIAPDFSRVSPMKGLGRLLSVQSLFTLFKAISKLVILASITWMALSSAWPMITGLSGAEAPAVLQVARSVTTRLVLFSGLGFLALSGADYGFAIFQHGKQLKMTRQEVVQEHRESEGDPQIKSRMRGIAQALSRKRMMGRVKEADVVVVNPTNIAVAIKYDGASASAPIVLAMGRRKMAEKIRELAKAANVPIVQNIPVARALIAGAEVGKPIPPALYAAVAEVLAFVYRMRAKLPYGLDRGRTA